MKTFAVEKTQSVVGAHPKPAAAIFVQPLDVIGRQSFRRGKHIKPDAVEPAYAATLGANPEVTFRVLAQGEYLRLGQVFVQRPGAELLGLQAGGQQKEE